MYMGRELLRENYSTNLRENTDDFVYLLCPFARLQTFSHALQTVAEILLVQHIQSINDFVPRRPHLWSHAFTRCLVPFHAHDSA